MNDYFYGKFVRLPLVVRVLFISSSFIVLFGVIIHYIEPTNFPTIFEGVWWAIETASTVGFGDYIPRTVAGKVTAIILIFVGAAFVSSYYISLAAVAVTRQNAFIEGKLTYKGKHHMIIVGWNERSREIITSLTKKEKSKKIILIDETLDTKPSEYHNVHFIKGRANLDKVLLKANLLEAEAVIITADQNKDELQADMNSIITLLAIKGLHPTIRCIVEILTSEQVLNAKRAGADEIIQTNIITSSLVLNSLTSHSTIVSIIELIHHSDNHHRLTCEPVLEEMVGKTFYSACSHFFQKNKMMVGIKRGEETHVNPPNGFIVQQGDQAIVITG
jgi:voltage-gated potassium channel